METKEYRTMNKAVWNERGPWDHEPDKMQFPDAATGLPCLIVRNRWGALCGYVGVADGHPLYNSTDHDFDVHGGITFTNFCADTDDESRHICHVAGPGEPERVWWFGFDCGHSCDFSPNFPRNYRDWDETYRDVPYVKRECEKLAAQLAAWPEPPK